MPKKSGKSSWGGRGGGRRPTNSDDKHFFGHDDRTTPEVPTKGSKNNGGNRPRVSFKNPPFKNSSRNRDRDRIAASTRDMVFAAKRILDDDSPMSGGTSNNNVRDISVQQRRGRGVRRGRNSPLSHRGAVRSRNHESKRAPLGSTIWHSGSKSSHGYRITIPCGHKHDKAFIIDLLRGWMAPDTFVPIMYRVNENTGAVFYVDEQKTAQKLQDCNWKITTADGFKMQVRVEPGFPQYNLDQPMKDRMKQAMAKRYVQETNALDLSRFHHDPDLVDDYYCALTRPSILSAALDIVATVIPNLKALNLDNNQLQSFDKLNLLSKKLPSLKILYIGDNKLKDMHQINAIRALKLEELRLAGNPLCDKYKERHDDYVSDVRNKFPQLERLDGAQLPAAISFDLANDRVDLPPSQRLFAPNAKAQEIASEFLQQYFRIYDSGNRQPLLDAYHEQASFSLTVAQTYNNNNKFNSYVSENRNLCKVLDPAKRRKLLKQGRLPVVSYISELPRTQHDLTSFTMDIGLVTEGMMMITVSGLFKQIEAKESPIRYFSRTFIIVPEGSGYCISNEMLHIRKATERQEKHALEAIQDPCETQVPVASASSSTAVAPVAGTEPQVANLAPISDDVRTQMTLALSERTNMNLQWSLKCLEEVKWDFMTALAAFHEIHSRGQIPPDAFKK